MSEWYSDQNLRTPRSMREAGIEGELAAAIERRDRQILWFLAGFLTGVMGVLMLTLSGVLP